MAAVLDPNQARGERPGGDRPASVISGPRRGARETWVEIPSPDGEKAAWCYSDRRAYGPGDTVTLFLSATVKAVSLTISRDPGHEPAVFSSGVRDAQFFAVPDKCYEVGCGWPAFLTWTIPDDLDSGGYLVEIRDETSAQREVIGHHLFFHRRRARTPGALALVASTSTWSAYNDWGGANHYYGTNAALPRGRAPLLSALRPWARGQVWLPAGAPRSVNQLRPTKPGPARYDCIEWAFINGFTRYYSLAGWASYERPFLQWAEANGYRFDIFTQDC
jgi:peptide methionine sulfoxide reductase MsrB